MHALKMECEKCGCEVLFQPDETLIRCIHCQTVLVRPSSQGEPLRILERANELWTNCRFGDAEKLYQAVLAKNPDEYEARWKLLLCKYGVKYVTEQSTGTEYIICMRAQASSLRSEPEYHEACRLANDPAIVAKYEQDAAYIDGVQAQISQLKLQGNRPFEVFICFKDKDDQTRERTKDSIYAQQLYRHLNDLGYRVFYSPITLKDVSGKNYEAAIHLAIETARVMLVLGTRRDYFEASWVRSEWERFLHLRAESAPEKVLIPLFLQDEFTMPKAFTNLYLQGIDLEQDYLLQVEQQLDHLLRKTERDKRKVDTLQAEVARLKAELAKQQQKAAKPQPKPEAPALSYTAEKYFKVKPYQDGVYIFKYTGSEAEVRIPRTIDGKPVRSLETENHIPFAIGLSPVLSIAWSLLSVKGVFEKHQELISVAIPYGVYQIGFRTFAKCSQLTNVFIPNSVKEIRYSAFDRCSSLTKIIIPSSVDNIDSHAFDHCVSLTDVALSNGLQSIGSHAFDGCTSLKEITIPFSVFSIGDDAFDKSVLIRCAHDSFAAGWAQKNGYNLAYTH